MDNRSRNVIIDEVGRCLGKSCPVRNTAILEIDHIRPQSMNGSKRLHNLTVLCPNCHTLKHQGKTTVESIQEFLSEQKYESLEQELYSPRQTKQPRQKGKHKSPWAGEQEMFGWIM